MRAKVLLTVLLLLGLATNGMAQQRGTVRGTVTNESFGDPMPGVNVSVEGTTIGTATGTDGSYSLEVGVGQVLLFSFVGFDPLRVTVESSHFETPLDVSMSEDEALLDEVVVVGYGYQRKSEITAAITSLNLEEIEPIATQRVDQMLQGRASGVLVLNTDGAPGGNTMIRIRGMNSIQGGNDALIVVDGLQGGELSSLNPNDIESIEVLKDASATAIYGSQGANGVVLITTKRGRTGKPRLSYRSEVGVASITKKIDLLSAAEFARIVNAYEMADNVGREPQPIFSQAEIEQFEREGGTDWQDVMYRDAVTQNHQLSMSGGMANVNYFVSGAYLDQSGILINSGYDRYTMRAKVSADFTDWIGAGISWDGSRESDHNYEVSGGQRTAIGMTLRFPPVNPIFEENGQYSEIDERYGNRTSDQNPYANAVEPVVEHIMVRNNLSGYLQIDLLDELSLQITGGARIFNDNFRRYLNRNTVVGREAGGRATATSTESNYYQNSNILTYRNSFGRHSVTATGVFEQQHNLYNWNGIENQDFLNDNTGVYDLAGSNIKNTSSSESKRTILSGLARLNYEFDNTYLLAASYRADGSSVFGLENKWSYFPSASIGWRVSEYPFVRDLNVFDNLMLRASWGKTGNQAINPYQTLARIVATGNYPYDGAGENTGFRITSAANSFLRWETTRQYNIGLDLRLLAGRIQLSADYYDKITDDLLMLREIPSHTGLTSIIDNVGSMGNKGVEISLDLAGGAGKLDWLVGGNFTASETTVLDLGDTDELAFSNGGSGHSTNLPFMYLTPGQPFGQMRGWRFEGIWGTDEAEEAARYGQLPGDIHYADVNDDGRIDINDQVIIGNAIPDYIFGFNTDLAYGNWDMQMLIQGSVGNDIFNITRIGTEVGIPTSARVLDRWTPDNQDSDIPAIIDGRTRQAAGLVSTISFPTSSGNTYSRFVEDGSYVRLKQVSLGYALPVSLASRLSLDRLRLSLSATNLITFTDYSGYDPEVSSFTRNDAQLGSDFYNYPQSRTFTLAVGATF